jgi:rubrerythrin
MAPDISKLLAFDADGALEDAAGRLAEAGGSTRGSFLRRSGALVAGTAAATMLPAGLASAATPKGDVAILNYALTLEYLEAAFYQRAVDIGALRGEYQRFAKVVAQHEAAHVAALKKALGSKAVKRPSFDFQGTTGDQTKFGQTAITLEDTGVEAYQGQAGNIKTPAILKAALSIHPVEARHAAWIRSIVGHGTGNPSPAPEAFNPAADMATVLKAVKGTGFIVMKSASASSAVAGDPAMTG